MLLELAGLTLPSNAYRALVCDENCLARSSAGARAKTWEELKKRYLLDVSHPLFAAFGREWQRCSSEPERQQTAYVLLALNDPLIASLGTDWLFALLRRAPSELRVADVVAFIARASGAHPEVEGWTPATTLAVAQKYLASLRDFGLAQGTMRKTTVRPALYGAPVRLLVRALQLADVKAMALVQHPIFRLLAIDGPEVIDALGELHRQGELRFRMQADVIEIELEPTR